MPFNLNIYLFIWNLAKIDQGIDFLLNIGSILIFKKGIGGGRVGAASLMGTILAAGLISLSYIIFVTSQVQSSKRAVFMQRKFFTRLVAESVADAVVTLSPIDFYNFTEFEGGFEILQGYVGEADSSTQLGWLDKWIDMYPYIKTITMKICLFDEDDSGPPFPNCLTNPADAVFPKNFTDFSRHNAIVYIKIVYFSTGNKLGKNTKSEVNFEKWVLGE